MKKIRPLDVFLWSFRRNERDVVTLYDSLSDVMRLSTGGDMLNFGFWDDATPTPMDAQKKLCMVFAKLARLESGQSILDVGSGLSAPAFFWAQNHENLKITCININYSQLLQARKRQPQMGAVSGMHHVNSTATKIPISSDSMDRILAFESAQHFKPIGNFFSECKRILKDGGILSLAIPIMKKNYSRPLAKLGILSMTWSSEHYSGERVLSDLEKSDFTILEKSFIGENVYAPMAAYYSSNRVSIRQKILEQYPSYVENILWKSIKKMKETSENMIIDYMLVSCKK